VTAKLPLLISYAYLREEKPETIERILTNPLIELLLDCGAFTAMNAGAEISLSEYIEFILFKREVAQVISLTQSEVYRKANDVDVETWSCEQWAIHLIEICGLSKCEVSEDGENGAIVEA
jgi:hypothetical protein